MLLPEGGSGLQRPAPIVGHPPQEALQPPGHDAPLLLQLADVAARFSSSASITSIITSGFVAAAAVAPWKGGRRWTERLGGGDCNVLVYCYEFSKLIQVL